MRVFDVSQHDIALVETLITETAFHKFQVAQLICVACIRLSEDSLVEHLLVNVKELFLRAIDVDQS